MAGNANSGRRPTPTPILKARGSWRAKARGKNGEPAPPLKAPSCPSWLDVEARREWKRATRLLLEMGVLAEIDRAFLASYCAAYAEMVRMEALIGEADQAGADPAKSWLLRRDRAAERLGKFGAQFGLSPTARPRLRAAAPDQPAGGKSRFFGGKGAEERFFGENVG